MKVKVQRTVTVIMDIIVDAKGLPDAIRKVKGMRHPEWKNVRKLMGDQWSAEDK